MKIICMRCDSALKYQENTHTSKGYSIRFHCEKCGDGITMEVDAADSELISALGLRIGKGINSEETLDKMKSNLREMGGAGELEWTKEAAQRLERVPGIARMMAQSAIEQYAKRERLTLITPEIMDRVKAQVGHQVGR